MVMTSNGSLKRDDNDSPVMGGTSSSDNHTIINAAFDPVTRRLLVDSAGGGTGTVTEVDTGTGLTGGPITTTGTVALDSKLAPLDTLGSAGQSIRVNAGVTALEYYTPSTGAPGGSNTQIQYNNSGAFGGVAGMTTDGTIVTVASSDFKFAGSGSGTTTVNASAAASGILTLPAATDTLIGKATTDTLTNKTYDTAGVGNSFSINSVAVTANTGTGAVARATSPTFVTPVLGVAAATTLNKVTITTPATGSTLTIADGKTFTLSNTLTFTGTDTSSVNFGGGGTVLYSASTIPLTVGSTTITSGATTKVLFDNAGVLGEYTISGSGNVAMTTSPVFTTPTLGAATATSINGMTITSSTGTFTLTNAKTLAVTNTITLSGTDSTTMTFPTTTATIARTDAAQTFTGTQTFSQVITTANAITASGNAATVPVTSRHNIVTNNSAATLTITLTTASAVNMQTVVVQILDASAAAQTITWVNTENSTVSAPTTSNGSTTLPLTVGFMYNSATSKWRCIASA